MRCTHTECYLLLAEVFKVKLKIVSHINITQRCIVVCLFYCMSDGL